MNQKFYIRLSFQIVGLFILMQFLHLLFFDDTSNFFVFGTIQCTLLFGLFIFFITYHSTPFKKLLFGIFIYQFIFVLFSYLFYTNYYDNPLGYLPKDAMLYDNLAIKLQNLSFSESIRVLNSNNIGLSDYGFPLLLKIVYSIGGNPIFNMKFFNVLFHVLTCLFVYRLSNIISNDAKQSKIALIFFGLNPISIYFNSSGLKEPFFILIITLCFYYCYKALLSNQLKYYILGILFLISTGFFRSIFPIFIVLSFGVFKLFSIGGRYKLIIRGILLVLVAISLMLVFVIVRDDIDKALGVDNAVMVSHRLGRTPNSLDYFIMFLSGLIGPFPSFDFSVGNDAGLLQTLGNFYKLFCSYFFIIGLIQILRNKMKEFYPILFFILFNIVMVVSVAAALDHRYLYPFIPVYFIVIGLGVKQFSQKRPKGFLHIGTYLILISVLIISYNLR